MEEGGSGDGFNVGLIREGRVQDDTQVANLGGWRDGAAIHREEKISNLLQLRLGTHDHEFCFLTVEFE